MILERHRPGRPPQREPFWQLQRLVEIGLAGVGQVRQRLFGRRIDDVSPAAAAVCHLPSM